MAPHEKLSLSNISRVHRASGANVVSNLVTQDNQAYTYAPSAMVLKNRVIMMFCGPNQDTRRGDAIYKTERPTGSAQWNRPTRVFGGSPRGFDALHTCDPSLLYVHTPGDHSTKSFIMYYSGAATDEHNSHSGAWTSIGVAQSKDGKNWKPVTDEHGKSRAIVLPANPKRNSFGAGQPSVVYHNETFYMLYTDSTMSDTNCLVLIRSKDWLFRPGKAAVEAFDPKTGKFVNSPNARTRVNFSTGADHDMAFTDDLIIMTTLGRKPGELTGRTFVIGFARNQKFDKREVALSDRMASNNSSIVRTPTGDVYYNSAGEFTIVRTVLDDRKKNNKTNPPRLPEFQMVWESSLESVRMAVRN